MSKFVQEQARYESECIGENVGCGPLSQFPTENGRNETKRICSDNARAQVPESLVGGGGGPKQSNKTPLCCSSSPICRRACSCSYGCAAPFVSPHSYRMSFLTHVISAVACCCPVALLIRYIQARGTIRLLYMYMYVQRGRVAHILTTRQLNKLYICRGMAWRGTTWGLTGPWEKGKRSLKTPELYSCWRIG